MKLEAWIPNLENKKSGRIGKQVEEQPSWLTQKVVHPLSISMRNQWHEESKTQNEDLIK